jgi:SdpC family antimicrobial peptide
MKRFGRVAGIVSAGIVAAVIAACADVNSPAPAPLERAAVRSGEEMFRGIVFGEGTVGRMLPEVWGEGRDPSASLGREKLQRYERNKTTLIARMRTADADFFTRFGADVQSGDHLRIERAMDESAALIRQVAGAPDSGLSNPGTGVGNCVAVAAVLAVAVAGNAVAVVNAVVAANAAVTSNWVYNTNYFWGKKLLAPSESRLGRDQVIHMFAGRFASL